MRRLFLYLFVLLICNPGAAFAQMSSLRLKNKLFIRCTPTSLLDPYGSRFPIGVEYGVDDWVSLGGEISIPLLRNSGFVPGLLEGGGGPVDQKRITSDLFLRVDIRSYVNASRRARGFIGAEFFWRNQEYHDVNGYYYENSTSQRYTNAEVYKNMFGIGFVIGGNVLLRQTVFIEPYCGLGIRHFAVHRLNVEDPQKGGKQYFSPDFILGGNENEVEGERTGLYFPLGVKLSVPLKRK